MKINPNIFLCRSPNFPEKPTAYRTLQTTKSDESKLYENYFQPSEEPKFKRNKKSVKRKEYLTH